MFSPGLAAVVKEVMVTGTSKSIDVIDVTSPSGVLSVAGPRSASSGTRILIRTEVCCIKADCGTLTPVSSMAVTLFRLFPIKLMVSPCCTPAGPKLSSSTLPLLVSLSFLHDAVIPIDITMHINESRRVLNIIFIIILYSLYNIYFLSTLGTTLKLSKHISQSRSPPP